MAKTFGISAGATTGFTAVGTLRNYTETTNAEVTYSRAAAGTADSDDGGIVQPKTASAQLELVGTAAAAGDTITVSGQAYIVTKASTTWEVPGATVQDVEMTQKLS